jgi:hypothetical protein
MQNNKKRNKLKKKKQIEEGEIIEMFSKKSANRNRMDIDDEYDSQFINDDQDIVPIKNKSIAHQIFQRDKKGRETDTIEKNLKSSFHFAEDLADEYITEQDQQIKGNDIPERILIRYREKYNHIY